MLLAAGLLRRRLVLEDGRQTISLGDAASCEITASRGRDELERRQRISSPPAEMGLVYV